MQIQEGQRLSLFIKQDNITQYELADVINKKQSDVSRYIDGSRKIPIEVVKILHLKLKLNYTWFFHGTGSMKVKENEQKKLMNNISDIMAGMGVMMASQDQMRQDIINLHRIIDELKQAK